MSLRSRIGTWWRALRRGDRVRAQVEEELRFHIESYAEDLMRGGIDRDEALRQAKAELGSVAAAKENARQAWGTRWLDELWGDLGYALRRLRKSPGFAMIAVGSLALRIGANTAIFSMTNTLLLEAMPVAHPEQLRLLEWQAQHQSGYKYLPMESLYGGIQVTKTGVATGAEFSYAEYRALRRNDNVFDGMTAYYHAGGAALEADNSLENGTLEYVAPNFFQVLGVHAAAGRTISPADGVEGGAPVVVLSDWLWRDMYGRSSSAIGSRIEVNRVPMTVVGVAPRSFHGAGVDLDPALYLPLGMQPRISPEPWERGRSRLKDPEQWWVRILGRIHPGVTNAQAQGALNGTFRETAKATLKHPARIDRESVQLVVTSGARADSERTDENFKPVAFGLSALAGLVLTLACVNLANLLLARSATRKRELSVRMALGARRGRVARQLLTESLVLALTGGAVGTALAFATRNAIPHFLEHQPPVFDWRVYGFTAGLTLLTGMLFGGIPAWRATRLNPRKGLQDGARSTADRSHARLGKGMAVVQICLSMVLLAGAGLFVRTVRNLLNAPLGFAPQHVLLFELALQGKSYSKPEECAAAFRQIEERLRTIPGVLAASFSGEPLVNGGPSTTNFDPAGEPRGSHEAWMNVVGDGFFGTMRIPLLRGRGFGQQDGAKSQKVAIINERLARLYFPGRDPIGLTFNSPPIRIIGIAGNTKFSDLRQTPPPTYYVPESQNGGWNQVTFEVRTAGDPLALAHEATRTVHAFDQELPLSRIRTQEEQIQDSIRDVRLFAMLAMAFGVLALVLACIGIYGLLAYQVAQRTNEIGVRMALGAERRRVLTMVMCNAAWMAIMGIVIGVGVTLELGRLMASLLYEVKFWDPVALAGAALVLMAVALAASWIPARRAAGVDPMQALRHE